MDVCIDVKVETDKEMREDRYTPTHDATSPPSPSKPSHKPLSLPVLQYHQPCPQKHIHLPLSGSRWPLQGLYHQRNWGCAHPMHCYEFLVADSFGVETVAARGAIVCFAHGHVGVGVEGAAGVGVGEGAGEEGAVGRWASGVGAGRRGRTSGS